MILLTSDTETKPNFAMRQAIAQAEVGDEQKGEDPTVNRLLKWTHLKTTNAVSGY